MCLHWLYAHLSAVLELCTYAAVVQCTSVTRSVSSNSAVIDDLGCATYFSSTDDVSDHQLMMLSPSAATIRSKCHQHVLALMFCTSVFCTLFQSTSVTKLVSRVR
ncbi:TPA: hypothetical protein ACH3X2_003214 [Trebouxia sp. C0005]